MNGEVKHRSCDRHKRACLAHMVAEPEPEAQVQPPPVDEFARGLNAPLGQQPAAFEPDEPTPPNRDGMVREGKTVRLPTELWAKLRARALQNKRSDVRELEAILEERFAQCDTLSRRKLKLLNANLRLITMRFRL